MMSDDRRRILQMVADGTITAEEASELLDALQPEPKRREAAAGDIPLPEPPARPAPPTPPRSPRILIIQVTEGDSNRVNLRIPLGLARAAGKFIPRRAQEHLSEYGIDLAGLFEGITDSDQGVILQVQEEEDRVLIAVE